MKVKLFFQLGISGLRLCLLPLFVLLLCCSSQKSMAQKRIGFNLLQGKKRASVSFELINNLIIIPMQIDEKVQLKFILDTGAQATILTEKAFGDAIGLDYVRSIRIAGPGIANDVEAFVAPGVQLNLSEEIQGDYLSLLVLKDDYLQLNENLGDEVYGIIGFDLFSRFIVEINYDNYKVTFYDPKYYRARKKRYYLDITLADTKPYVQSKLYQQSRPLDIRLMVDTGASHAVLLDVFNTDDLVLPETTISARLGRGLGGEIPGLMGRLPQYSLGNFTFEDVLVSIPELGAYSDDIKRGSRHGTVGGELLNRFTPTFDYFNKKLYLRKGRNYKDPFEFDMSGLTLGVVGEELDTLVVRRVQEETQADLAGIQKGDTVLMINGKTLNNSKFSEINSLLREKPGYNIKVTLKKGDKTEVKRFKLERRI